MPFEGIRCHDVTQPSDKGSNVIIFLDMCNTVAAV